MRQKETELDQNAFQNRFMAEGVGKWTKVRKDTVDKKKCSCRCKDCQPAPKMVRRGCPTISYLVAEGHEVAEAVEVRAIGVLEVSEGQEHGAPSVPLVDLVHTHRLHSS